MGPQQTKIDENSVKFALREILDEESIRQESEELERRRREAEEQRRREEADKEAEEQRRREEEEARRAAKRAEEDRIKAEAEQQEALRLKIEIEAKHKARGAEQQRILDDEAKIKQFVAQKKKLQKWLIAIPSVLILVGAIAGFAWYRSGESQRQAERRTYLEKQKGMQTFFEVEVQKLQQALADSKKREQHYRDALIAAHARDGKNGIQQSDSQFREAEGRSARSGRRQNRGSKKQEQRKGKSRLSDDPLGGFKLE